MGKKRRRAKKRLFGRGWSGGYAEYRYGPKQPVKLAGGPKLQPVFRGDKRKHVVSKIMDMLRDWRLSPFEFEAPTLQALRSGLCLEGHGWHCSEVEASTLVAEALHLLGPKRPSWQEGQPEYCEPRDNCPWCRRPLDEYRMKSRFCSPHCAGMWVMHRDYEDSARGDALRAKATKLLSKARMPERTCRHCGNGFRPWSAVAASEFCSKPCMYAFRDSEAAARHEKDCAWCGAAFRAKTAAARFCKPLCQVQEKPDANRPAGPERNQPAGVRLRFRSPQLRPDRCLTPDRFDQVFALAA